MAKVQTEPADPAEAAHGVTDSAIADTVFSDTELRGITSFEDALALVQETYGDVLDAADEIGSGFVLLKDKNKLVDVPFIILSFSFPEGDFTDENGLKSHFSVMRVVTERGDRYVVVDGSTGIYDQLDQFYGRSGRNGGMMVKGGLRRSDYEYTDAQGKTSPASTYYLNV